MSAGDDLPAWKLPTGVNAALWRYAHTPRLADDEDAYFAGHPLFRADRDALDARFVDPGTLVDLGAGAGRLSVHFAARGFEVTAVDLSASMLRAVGDRAREVIGADHRVRRVQANLCDLRSLPDATFDYAVSMFSTLGMIRGPAARRRALCEAARVLRPGGRLALHAHNLFLNLRDPQGRRWLASQLLPTLLRRPDAGDRRMTYRRIPGMEVHLYRWPELRRELTAAGFRIDETLPIDPVHARPIPYPRLLPSVRAGGWIVFAHTPKVGDGGTS